MSTFASIQLRKRACAVVCGCSPDHCQHHAQGVVRKCSSADGTHLHTCVAPVQNTLESGHEMHPAKTCRLCRLLQPVSSDAMLRIESGDPTVKCNEWPAVVLISSSRDIYALIEKAVTKAAQLSGKAKPRTEKKVPDCVNGFGWCTWDAFYSGVSAEVCPGIERRAVSATQSPPYTPSHLKRTSVYAAVAVVVDQDGH